LFLLQVLVFLSRLVDLGEGGWHVLVLYKRVKACFVVLFYASVHGPARKQPRDKSRQSRTLVG